MLWLDVNSWRRGLKSYWSSVMVVPHWQEFRPTYSAGCSRYHGRYSIPYWMTRRDSSTGDENRTMTPLLRELHSCTGCECQNALIYLPAGDTCVSLSGGTTISATNHIGHAIYTWCPDTFTWRARVHRLFITTLLVRCEQFEMRMQRWSCDFSQNRFYHQS